jgi:hypothetical protein
LAFTVVVVSRRGHPGYRTGAARRNDSAALRGEVDGGLMERVETPEDFDIAVAGSSHHPHHVGVVVSCGVLHAARASGSVWQPLPRFLMIYPQTEYYRWHR